MVFIPLKKEEVTEFIPLIKPQIETQRLSGDEPTYGFIGGYKGKNIVQEAGTGTWYTQEPEGFRIIPQSDKELIEESEIIKGGVAETYLDPTLAAGAGGGMAARLAVKGVSKILSKEAVKAGAKAAAISAAAEVPAGIGAELITEGKHPEWALPFSILVGMGAESGIRAILKARKVPAKAIEKTVKEIKELPPGQWGNQKLLEAPLSETEIKLLPEGQGFELVEKFEALKRAGRILPEEHAPIPKQIGLDRRPVVVPREAQIPLKEGIEEVVDKIPSKLEGEFVPIARVKPAPKVEAVPEVRPEIPIEKPIVRPEAIIAPEPIAKPIPEPVVEIKPIAEVPPIEPYAIGGPVKIGRSPQVNTIIEELPSTKLEKELGERYFKVKNEKTGEITEQTFEDLTPIVSKRKPAPLVLEPTLPAVPRAQVEEQIDLLKVKPKFPEAPLRGKEAKEIELIARPREIAAEKAQEKLFIEKPYSFATDVKERFPDLNEEEIRYIASQVADDFQDMANRLTGKKAGATLDTAKAWKRFAETGKEAGPRGGTRSFDFAVDDFEKKARIYVERKHKGIELYAGIPITPENIRHAAPAIVGSAWGIERDEEGNLSYSPAKGMAAAAALYSYARIPIKGATIAERTTTKATQLMDKLFRLPYLKAFHPKAGLSDELYELKKKKIIEERSFRHKTLELTNKMIKNFSEDERALISDIIEQEGDFLKATDRLRAQADIIKKWNAQVGDKLEALGMIDKKNLRVDPDKYIHRVYAARVDQKVLSLGKAFFDRIRGGYTIPRGQVKHIPVKKDWSEGDKILGILNENGRMTYIAKKAYKPKDGAILKEWTFEGIEEAGKLKGKSRLHRDYTRAERKSMGEIRDAAVRQGVYFQEIAHDMATANMFKKIEADPRWFSAIKKEGFVQVPNTTVGGAKGGIKKFGSLAGKYVDPEVMRTLKEVKPFWKQTGNADLDAAFSGYRKAMGYWKLGKTALNPTVHFNNFVSNISMSILDGRNPAKVIYDGSRSLKLKDDYFKEAVEHGLLDSNMVRGDIDVEHILQKLEGVEIKTMNQTGVGKLLSAMFAPVKKIAKGHIRAYEIEDEIYKLGVYKAERVKGLSPEEAMGKANELFFDYSDIPVGVQAIRDFGVVPFITYTYKALPVVAKKYLEAPHRIIALYLGAKALNDYSYSKLYGENAQEQELRERTLMPEYMRGAGPPGLGFAPKSIRLPFGETMLDISRIAPGGDVLYQANPGYKYGLMLGQNPLLLTAIALATNKDAYFGNKIRPFDTPISEAQEDENQKAEISFLANTMMPNHPAIPGSWSFDKIGNAMTGEGLINERVAEEFGWTGTDRIGRKMSSVKAALSTVGVKMRDLDTKEGLKNRLRELTFQKNQIERHYRKIKGSKASTQTEIKNARRIVNETVMEIKRINKELRSLPKSNSGQ
ncbi:hypothetical protein KAR91_64510 [Candidatus Pacearchaeota archaeon]|nr:hypothetical protein [Candidatus Pacearchaeota archaeon]